LFDLIISKNPLSELYKNKKAQLRAFGWLFNIDIIKIFKSAKEYFTNLAKLISKGSKATKIFLDI